MTVYCDPEIDRRIQQLTDALLELRTLASSGSAEMAIIDEALAGATSERPWTYVAGRSASDQRTKGEGQ